MKGFNLFCCALMLLYFVFVHGANAQVFSISENSTTIEIPRSANVVDASFYINTSDTLINLSLDVGSNGDMEWGPVNFSSANGTVQLNDSNAGLISALNALIPQVNENAMGVNYTYNETSNNVTIELNFISQSPGNLTISSVNISYVLWFNLYGNVSGNIKLSDGFNDFKVWDWANSLGNVYATDSDSNINWSALKPLGYKKDGSVSSVDFQDISKNLYMHPGFNISDTFSSDGTSALDVASFTVYGYALTDVPIVNSTDKNNHNLVSSSDFITGVMWDSSDDKGNNEYDTTDCEDIVFVTNINVDRTSEVANTKHDYEFVLPANFGSHKGNNDNIMLYVELK